MLRQKMEALRFTAINNKIDWGGTVEKKDPYDKLFGLYGMFYQEFTVYLIVFVKQVGWLVSWVVDWLGGGFGCLGGLLVC